MVFSSLAHVSVNPHSRTGGSFFMIKKKLTVEEPEFVLRLEPEPTYARLSAMSANEASVPTDGDLEDETMDMLEYTKADRVYQWARSKQKGRAHTTDTWELMLKKDERLKVVQSMGNGWYMLQNSDGDKGWAHVNSLVFEDNHEGVQEAYARWEKDMATLFRAGEIRSFPDLTGYMNDCRREGCRSLKTGLLGICAHDLRKLLGGSGVYSLEYLKTERNKWHPDKFARHCHAEHRETLIAKAEALFVLFGILIDGSSKK